MEYFLVMMWLSSKYRDFRSLQFETCNLPCQNNVVFYTRLSKVLYFPAIGGKCINSPLLFCWETWAPETAKRQNVLSVMCGGIWVHKNVCKSALNVVHEMGKKTQTKCVHPKDHCAQKVWVSSLKRLKPKDVASLVVVLLCQRRVTFVWGCVVCFLRDASAGFAFVAQSVLESRLQLPIQTRHNSQAGESLACSMKPEEPRRSSPPLEEHAQPQPSCSGGGSANRCTLVLTPISCIFQPCLDSYLMRYRLLRTTSGFLLSVTSSSFNQAFHFSRWLSSAASNSSSPRATSASRLFQMELRNVTKCSVT